MNVALNLACKNVSSSPLIKCCYCCKLRQASFGLKARSQIGYKQSIFESCINRVNAFMSLLTDILSMVSREPRRLALARIQGTEQNLAKKYHPDIYGDPEKFAEINAAFNIL